MRKSIITILTFMFFIPTLLCANIGTNLRHLGIYAQDSLIIDTNIIVIGQSLNIGVLSGTVTEISDSIYSIDDSLASVELGSLYTSLTSLTFVSPTVLDSDTLVANNYVISSGNFPNNVFLDGDSNSVFVFHVTGNLNFTQYTKMRTWNVRKSNIFWVIDGDIKFESCSFPGIFISTGNIKVIEGNYDMSALLSMHNIKMLSLSGLSKVYSEESISNDYIYLNSGGCNLTLDPCDYIWNGDFEANFAIPQGTQSLFTCNWFNPSNNGNATPDHFTTLSPLIAPVGFGSVAVPINALGNQTANTGGSYVGIFTRSNAGANYKEFIESQLTQPLTSGNYFLSMFLSTGDNCPFATDNFGAKFTSNRINQVGSTINFIPAITPPEVLSTPGAPLINCNGWLRHTGCFHANGGENYITIGSFANDNNQTVGNPNCTQAPFAYNGAYYYIDDVSLVRIPDAANFSYTTPCTIPINIGPSLDNCVLNNPDFTYSWTPSTNLSDPNIPNPDFQTNVTGIYNYQLHLDVAGCNDVVYNVQITVTGIQASITGSTILPCNPNNLVLTANPSGLTYIWTDLSSNTVVGTSQQLTVTHTGIYQVEVNDGSCISFSSVTISDPPPIQLLINPASQVICGEQPVYMSANCTNCISLIWDPIISNSSDIVVYPDQPTTVYTVTGTDAYGCTSTATSTITLTQIPIITGTIAHCKDDDVILSIQNFDPKGIYSWSATGTIAPIVDINGNNSQVQLFFNISLGGIVTLNYQVGECKGTVTYVIQGCCNINDNYHIPTGDNDTPINLTQDNFITSNYIIINGNFIIDRDFTFIGCHPIKFSPGAKMIVKSGITLTLDNCYLYPNDGDCCRMWRGIELEPGAKIILNNVIITQAEKAILAYNDCVLQVTNVVFYSNYIGIDLESVSGIANINLAIKKTVFYGMPYTCDGSPTSTRYFADPYDGQLTVIGTRPFAGILAHNVNVVNVFSGSPGGDITFKDLANGVFVKNVSQLFLANSEFSNMIPDLTYSPILGGANGSGLVANNSRFKFTGLGATPCISNSAYGAYLFNGNGTITDVTSMTSVTEGIYISNSSRVYIYKNNLGSSYFNIHTSSNKTNAFISIHDNSFSLPSATSPYGGNMIFTEALKTKISVFNNPNINVNNGRFGIYAYTQANTFVGGNKIYISEPTTYNGIVFSGGKNHNIKCNNVQAIPSLSTDPDQSGITVNMSQNTEVGGNIVDHENVGLGFNGACNNSKITVNSIYNHWTGLKYQFSPVTGAQINLGNQWLGGYSIYGATTTETNPLLISGSHYEYSLLGASTNHPPTLNNTGWFISNGATDDLLSNYSCAAPAYSVEDNGDKDEEKYRIARNEFDPETEFPEQNYESQRYLMEELYEMPELLLNDTLLTNFYNSNSNSSLGRYSKIKIDIMSALKGNADYVSSSEQILDQLDQKSDSLLLVLNSLLIDSMNQSLINLSRQLSEDINLLTVAKNELDRIANQIKSDNIRNLLQENQTLPENEIYERNEKIVNDIFLQTIAIDNFQLTEIQKLNLESIIYQCPFSGGKSVYSARILYSLIDPSFEYNDYNLCLSGGSARYAKINTPITMDLFPNPATSEVTLNYYLSDNQKAELRIVDQLGKLVYVTKLNPELKQLIINLSKLNSGIFTCQIIVDGIIYSSKLLSVVK